MRSLPKILALLFYAVLGAAVVALAALAILVHPLWFIPEILLLGFIFHLAAEDHRHVTEAVSSELDGLIGTVFTPGRVPMQVDCMSALDSQAGEF